VAIAWAASPAELELGLYQALVELDPTPESPARLAEARALLASRDCRADDLAYIAALVQLTGRDTVTPVTPPAQIDRR
jgi:hypothetical protein